MARNHSRTARRAGQVRLTDWGFLNPANTTLAASSVILGSLNAAALAMRPFTIIRQYYEIMLRSDQAAAVEIQIAGVGVCVVSDQASAIGITAIPTPLTDLGSDLWMLHQICMANAVDLTDRTIPARHYSIQSKSMRKVNSDEDMMIVAQGSAASQGMILSMGGRFLIKLH